MWSLLRISEENERYNIYNTTTDEKTDFSVDFK